MRYLYADVTGTTQIESITVSTSHSASVATAVISCFSTTLDVGDEIVIDMGYIDDHGRVFTGYVKNLDHITPNNTYQITAMDILSRAVDYFIVSSAPDKPYNFGTGLSAEGLINNVLGLCGLSIYEFDESHFTFGVKNPVEVNLVSCFDYCRMIADVITWSIWADEYGRIYFKNRKPFLMGTNTFDQLEWHADTTINPLAPLNSTQILNFGYKRDEKDLRNRVTVFGGQGISATVDDAESWDDLDGPSGNYITVLPTNFYKTIVASYVFIDTAEIAQQTAEYNMGLYNRIRNSLSITCEGNYRFLARKAIRVEEWITGIAATDWYILSSELSYSRDGFRSSLEVVR